MEDNKSINKEYKKSINKEYNKEDIIVLKGIEAIKQRPQMYIGSLDQNAISRIIFEVIFNSIDEYDAGYGKQIDISIDTINKIISIRDYGRGIPIGNFQKTDKSVFEVIVSEIHSGGKFGNKDSYKNPLGLHGVGLVVVNAFSHFMNIEVYKGNKIYYQQFVNGQKQTKQIIMFNEIKNQKGTKITFQLNENMFDVPLSFDDKFIKELKNKLLILNILNSDLIFNLKINKLKNIIINSKYNFSSFLQFKHNSFFENNKNFQCYFKESNKNHIMELCIGKNPSNEELIYSFVNNGETQSGTHVNSLKNTFTRFINEKAISLRLLTAKEERISGEDIRKILCFALHLKMLDPRFSSQTKTKLTNKIGKEINELYLKICHKFYSKFKKVFSILLTLIIKEREKRLFSNKNIKNNSISADIISCDSNDKNLIELVLVEGLSAGGTAKKARNSNYQAIFPMKGKMLNVAKVKDINKIVNNKELSTLKNELYLGDDSFNDIKYNKIIILSDADADGHHIRMLLITFFVKKMINVILNNHLFLAVPPLYCIRKKSSNKTIKYLYFDEELQKFSKENNMNRLFITRLKGLGEMNYIQLKETIFDNYDHIYQVIIEKDKLDDTLILVNDFMGVDVDKRKIFVLNNFFAK